MNTYATTAYATGTVVSRDGTTIGYRRLGSGPTVILVHGGMQAAQNLMKLGTALSDEFEVVIPDRRGRGMSTTGDSPFGIMRDVEDIQALAAANGATRIFGLSSGALIALRTALLTPSLGALGLYEPPLSVAGSVPVDWVPRFERELAAGRLTAALITSLKGLGVDPVMGRVPRILLAPALNLGTRLQGTAPGDVPLLDLVPTMQHDMQIVGELADTVQDYAGLGASTLLLGGTKSPRYLGEALGALERVFPDARRVTFDGLGHSGPDDDGTPERVAQELRALFHT